MVPMGDEVERSLEVWRGEMNAKVAGIGEVKGMVEDLAEKVDKLDTKVTVLTTRASIYAVMGGLVSSVVLSFVAAFGNKLIGGG